MNHIELMEDLSEIVHYEQAGIPLYIRTLDLSVYPDRSAPCHWHDDIEWIHIISGKMCYYINGQRIVLEKQDTLMVNARQMHYGYSYKMQDCRFSCILFHPSLFSSNKLILQRYIGPVIGNKSFTYLHIHGEEQWGGEVAEYLHKIVSIKDNNLEAYELEAIATMHNLWSWLLRKKELIPTNFSPDSYGDLEIQKDMVSFIYQHYAEKVSLDEIAASGHVSRSKCCHIFREYLQQSPMDFLNLYRLKVSCDLLCNTDKSITDIAFSCGFNHLSYFSKMFLEHYGRTPREYQKFICHKPLEMESD